MGDRELPTTGLVLPLEGEEGDRRTFLKLAGFGVVSAVLSACSRAPAMRVVPRLLSEAGVVPGRPYWIATTCDGCAAACGVLARCRDGRPVKLEGNPDHPLSSGGLCAAGQASLLSLYDSRRFDGPLLDGAPSDWGALDARVGAALAAAGPGRSVRILTRTVHGPSLKAGIAAFLARHPGEHVAWEPLSSSAILDAHRKAFGLRVLPRMRFDRARVIVSFGADFLGTWISPVEFAAGWRAGRRPDAAPPRMSRHVQLEARLSLTGTCADERIPLAPGETAGALAGLCAGIAEHSGTTVPPGLAAAAGPRREGLRGLARELWEARGESLVVSGSGDPAVQVLAALANHLLGNYGKTLDLERPSLQSGTDDGAMLRLLGEMREGKVGVLVIDGLNPAYDLPDSAGFREALSSVGLVVTTSPAPDETSVLSAAVAPAPHYLEAWGDAEPVAGHVSVVQPAIPPLRSTRTLRESLARWSGDEREDRDLLRDHWRTAIHARAGGGGSPQKFLHGALHDGVVEVSHASPRPGPFRMEAVEVPPAREPAPSGTFSLVLYPKVTMGDGSRAHNAWLQEVPDPVTKVVWDNYALLSPATAAGLGVADGDRVRIAAADGAASLELPVRIQPGQHDGAVAVALGYGRAGTDRFTSIGPGWLESRPTVAPGGVVGVRAAPLLLSLESGFALEGRAVRVERAGGRVDLAVSQGYDRLEVPERLAPPGGEVRDAVRSLTLADWKADPAGALRGPAEHGHGLWKDDHATKGPRWGMVVDLSACTGCAGCVVSCQAENNVPVVGRDEARRHREMHWIRIDRYYRGTGEAMEVSHQPMMCQHCGNAPCETVCPVLATVHGEDGLNQQVYNRCVGTRYCANNCPYKVRRFNWFDYPREDALQNLALNPDLAVRSRGVMEKCSLCIQRIQERRTTAKLRGTPLADGEIRTACQQSCPTGAIVFGDLNDPESRVSRLASSGLGYAVLGEINVRPSITYLARVRNRPPGGEGSGG